VYTAGKLVKTFSGSEETSGLTFAGSYLLGRPSCRKAPLQTDDDCDAPARLYTRSGTSLAVPVGTEDAHGSLLVYRGGDHTVSSTTFVVRNFRDATVAPITITLPSPGAGGYYTDVRIRGDWIGATQHLANGTVYPVLANYRTSTVTVGTTSGRLLELGSGIVVSALAHSTTLQVWQPATGATATIKAASSVVAVDGTRVVYVQSGRLVVARFAG
jgi:hypothetical protein